MSHNDKDIWDNVKPLEGEPVVEGFGAGEAYFCAIIVVLAYIAGLFYWS